MAKPELGTKRVDPETGKKFYDLNRDPIISPYTGISYPRSYFEISGEKKSVEEEDMKIEDLKSIHDKPEFVSLSDTEEEDEKDDDLPDLGDDEVNLGDDVDDTFLPEEDEDDDVTGIIGSGINSEDES